MYHEIGFAQCILRREGKIIFPKVHQTSVVFRTVVDRFPDLYLCLVIAQKADIHGVTILQTPENSYQLAVKLHGLLEE